MTGPRDDTPSRRAEDLTRRGRVIAWWRRWGQLIIGVGLIVVASVVLVIALQVREFAIERDRTEAATAKAARQSCERSRVLGPALLKDYELRRVLTGERLALYRSLIPKVCPSK